MVMQDEKPPRLFANHVLRQMAEHMLGDTCAMTRDDFVALRVVFKQCGGSWVKVESGDLVHIELLKKIVLSWGMLPETASRVEEII
jgi:hypothetical protein